MAGIDIDSPGQHAAMVEKLNLPFPLLSDPDRSLAIEPYGLSNPHDARNLAIPATVLVGSGGEEILRLVSRDYADRPFEDSALDKLRDLGLDAVSQAALKPGTSQPGAGAMRFADLRSYFKGAKFGAKAIGMRLEGGMDEAEALGELMDRYIEDATAMFKIVRDREDG